MKKLYFYRKYDQWKGIDFAVEDEINDISFLIQIPDLDDIERMYEGIASLKATFEDGLLGEATGVVHNKDRRIIKLINIPPEILTTNGIYRVSFALTTKRGEETIIERTAVQTFSILETVELNEEYIKNYDRYDEITQLLEKFYEEKVIDLTEYAKKEDVENLIEEALNGVNMDTIIAELETRGIYITSEELEERLESFKVNLSSREGFVNKTELNNILVNYVKGIDLTSTLGLYVDNTKLNTRLKGYVEKIEGKELSSNDFTDELKDKLLKVREDGNYDDSEIRDLISKKASHNYVDEKIESLNTINREDYYDKTIIDDYVDKHNRDISDLGDDIVDIENNIEENYLKKEDYQYADGINTDDIISNEKTLTEILKELMYKEIEIKYFKSTLISHLYEFRVDTLTSITLQWELNKNPISQSINIYNGTIPTDSREITISTNINTDTDIILTVVDENGVEKKSIIPIRFVFASYYGVYDDKLNVDIMKNGTKILINKENKTIDMSYINSKIFFAYPKVFGELVDIKDNNGLSYFNDFIFNSTDYSANGTSYNVYMLDEKATCKNISYSLIFKKEEE